MAYNLELTHVIRCCLLLIWLDYWSVFSPHIYFLCRLARLYWGNSSLSFWFFKNINLLCVFPYARRSSRYWWLLLWNFHKLLLGFLHFKLLFLPLLLLSKLGSFLGFFSLGIFFIYFLLFSLFLSESQRGLDFFILFIIFIFFFFSFLSPFTKSLF